MNVLLSAACAVLAASLTLLRPAYARGKQAIASFGPEPAGSVLLVRAGQWRALVARKVFPAVVRLA